eukprot:5794698-Prymnesium_polylepis.1
MAPSTSPVIHGLPSTRVRSASGCALRVGSGGGCRVDSALAYLSKQSRRLPTAQPPVRYLRRTDGAEPRGDRGVSRQ